MQKKNSSAIDLRKSAKIVKHIALIFVLASFLGCSSGERATLEPDSEGERTIPFQTDITVTIDDNVYDLNTTSHTACLNQYKNLADRVVIPDHIIFKGETYKIVALGDKVFYENKDVTDCQLPKSVIEIGHQAFAYSGITSIDLTNVIYIGDYSFQHCHELSYIKIGSATTNYGIEVFGGALCKHVELSEGIITIPSGLFFRSALESIALPEGLEKIESYAFAQTKLKSLIIPYSLNDIGEGAFVNNQLNEISVHQQNPRYDSRQDSNAIIETSTGQLIQGSSATFVPQDINSIGDHAFEGIKGLTKLKIPGNILSIGMSSFENSGLTSIIIPSSIETIGNQAFKGCPIDSIVIEDGESILDLTTAFGYEDQNASSGVSYLSYGRPSKGLLLPNLETLTIGHKNKEEDIFQLVSKILSSSKEDKLKKIISEITNPEEVTFTVNQFVPAWIYSKTILYVPKGTDESYRRAYGWMNFANIQEIR